MRMPDLDSGVPVVFSASNGVTFGSNGDSVTASVRVISAISAGTTVATQTQVVFSNANNVSWGFSTSAGGTTLTASTSAGAIIGISAGTQSVNTGTVVFSNSNNVTFGMSGSSRVTASYGGPVLDFF